MAISLWRIAHRQDHRRRRKDAAAAEQQHKEQQSKGEKGRGKPNTVSITKKNENEE
jgi:hypothetical protein